MKIYDSYGDCLSAYVDDNCIEIEAEDKGCSGGSAGVSLDLEQAEQLVEALKIAIEELKENT